MSRYYLYNGQLVSSEELRNWSEYVLAARPNELSHEKKKTKYIKKKLVNGKWRYYYNVKDALGSFKGSKSEKNDNAKKSEKSNAKEKTKSTKKHKYIKKKLVNGKWRYYYDIKDALGFDENAAYEKTKSAKKAKDAEHEKATVRRDMARDSSNLDGKITKDEKRDIESKTNKAKKTEHDKKKAAKEFIDSKKKFENTPLGFFKVKIPETFTKAKNWMKKTLDIGSSDAGKKKALLPNGKLKVFDKVVEYTSYLKRLAYQKSEPKFMKKIPKISENEVYTSKEDMDKINETYNPYNPATAENCANCSTAYELRRRGYDVEAKEADSKYNGKGSRFYDYFEDPKVLSVNGDGTSFVQNEKFTKKAWDGSLTTADALRYKEDYQHATTGQSYTASGLEKAIKDANPPGSRGMIDVHWTQGGGHSIVYEVDDKGKVTIRDSQTYDEYGLDELAHKVQRVTICRTDNLKLKEEILNTVEPNEDKKRRFSIDEQRLVVHYK